MSLREIEIAGVMATALRVSFVGELGWELHVDDADLIELYEALWSVGRISGCATSAPMPSTRCAPRRGTTDGERVRCGVHPSTLASIDSSISTNPISSAVMPSVRWPISRPVGASACGRSTPRRWAQSAIHLHQLRSASMAKPSVSLRRRRRASARRAGLPRLCRGPPCRHHRRLHDRWLRRRPAGRPHTHGIYDPHHERPRH